MPDRPYSVSINVDELGATNEVRWFERASIRRLTIELNPAPSTSEVNAELNAGIGIGILNLTGRFTEAGFVGNVAQDREQIGTFEFVQTVDVDNYDQYVGTYQFSPEMVVNISPSPAGNNNMSGLFLPGLWYYEFISGDYRAVTAIDEHTFMVGSALGIPVPNAGILTFNPNANGDMTSATWQSPDGELLTGTRLDFPTEDIAIIAEDGRALAGTITRPLTPAPHPAIVWVHGSGPITRQMNQRNILFLVNEGFAVLSYDKRGTGESEGAYRESASEVNLVRLAGDAQAGVELMTRQADIDPNRVGLVGVSQGGWIMPIVAAQSEDVAFMLARSGPVVTVGQEGAYSRFTRDGAMDNDVSASEVDAAVQAAAGNGFDPQPYIRELEMPALWLFGEVDQSIPIRQSIENLQAIIDQEGKTNFEYVLFPNSDHVLWESENGTIGEYAITHGFHPGVSPAIHNWLAQFLTP